MEVIRPLKLGTLTLPDSESRLVCRTILLDMLGEATITVEDGDLAGVTGLVWKHQELSLATVYLPRTSLRLTAHGVGTPDIVMLRATDGPLIVHHRRQTFEMGPRDVILLPSDTMSEIVLPEGGRLDCAHLPHAAITVMRKSIDCILLRPFSAECLPLQLLTNYAGYLLRQDHQDKEHASMMVAHFYSLLPVLAQYVAEAIPSAVPQGRLEAIKRMIEENLADGSFSIADVAQAEGITPRAIQKLFSRAGTTFSRYVLKRRLALAKTRILADNAATPISQIVYSVGFNDLSYFNRTFRSRYGISPTDLRRMTAQTV
ncbi:helix-turn-helix transcriptional regulator [Agrobacterium tumefaciens]|uniref:helix-turn-helix transcriptional regulator n=1 Tax=Agrobacterium tumefaciens TaxID=358 RepID=UPI00157195C7|nr:AraC family transcriptional regulator [Agrobacterium tumefaciens]WCJ65942.1 AraC family transcriptional regulator [Agrobacterium tumefaciens]